MREEYYGLGDGRAWAVMSQAENDPEPPILIFESADVAERYRQVVEAGDEWQVVEITLEEIEYHSRPDDRIMLCTDVNDRISKVELTLAGLMQRAAEQN